MTAVRDCSTQQANPHCLVESCGREGTVGTREVAWVLADLLDLVFEDIHNLSDLYQASQLQ